MISFFSLLFLPIYFPAFGMHLKNKSQPSNIESSYFSMESRQRRQGEKHVSPAQAQLFSLQFQRSHFALLLFIFSSQHKYYLLC